MRSASLSSSPQTQQSVIPSCGTSMPAALTPSRSSLAPIVNLSCRQIACADTILLNKVDLVDGERIRKTREALLYVPLLSTPAHCTARDADVKLITPIGLVRYNPCHSFATYVAIWLSPLDIHSRTPSRIPASHHATFSQINGSAPIIETVRGQVDLDRILDVNAYSAARNPSSRVAGPDMGAAATWRLKPIDSHEQGDVPHTHAHDLSGISTLAIPLPSGLSADQISALDLTLRSLLWEGRLPSSSSSPSYQEASSSIEILRTKGYFVDQDAGTEYVVQGVREIYELRQVGQRKLRHEAGQIPEEEGKLVLIGKGLRAGMVSAIAQAVALD